MEAETGLPTHAVAAPGTRVTVVNKNITTADTDTHWRILKARKATVRHHASGVKGTDASREEVVVIDGTQPCPGDATTQHLER